MAQSSGGGNILTIVLIGGAAWIGWNIYQSYLAAQAAAAAPPTPAPTPAPTAAPTPTPQIVIPANFSVTPDINNSLKGTVTYNGQLTSFNVIIPSGGYAGQTSGVVYNSQGQDVTALLGSANVQTLVNAFQAAQNQATITGVAGLGQVRPAVIPVPPAFRLRRIGIEG